MGSTASARAIATRWHWPPESSSIRFSAKPGSATSSNSSSASRRLWALATPRTSRPKATFSHTRIEGKSARFCARFWMTSAVGRWAGPTPRTSRPSIRITPSLGSTKPETSRRIVVLPQPEGPRIEKNSPGRTVRSTKRTAQKAP